MKAVNQKMKSNWTQEQQNAINSTGGSVLVSAAAGSGKTSVLVQRVIDAITNENNPADITDFLIVNHFSQGHTLTGILLFS